MRLHTLGLTTVALSVLAASHASAAVIAGYDFGTLAASTTAATTKDANVTAGSLVDGAQTININQNSTNYTSVPFRAISKNAGAGSTLATDRSAFYTQFTVTAAPGYELDLTGFSFDGSQGGGTAGERSYALHTSVDGLGLTSNSDIASGNAVKSEAFTTVRPGSGSVTMPTYGADLSAAKYQNLSSITLRIYFATINNGQNIDVDNFVLSGTVSPTVVPEPTAAVTAALLGVAGLARRRR